MAASAATPDGFVLDNIVSSLDDEQTKKLAELWARLDILTDGRIPDFSAASLEGLGVQTVKDTEGNTHQLDMSIMAKKPSQKVLADTNPAELLDALRRNVKHEDPDTLLVRFLRARQWRSDDALIMLLKSLAWRIETKIEEGMLAGGDTQYAHQAKTATGKEQKVAQECINLLSSGESAVHGYDAKGRLIQWIRVKMHKASNQGAEAFGKAIILDTESTRMLLRSPQTSVSIVFDLTGFGMANMDMNALKVMAMGLQDNYPECLGTVYVYNAPWIINGIWSMVKAWLDPVVAAKVQFIKNVEALSEHIPMENIPSYMGGKSPWQATWTEPEAVPNFGAEDSAKRDALKADRSKVLDDHINTTRDWALSVLTGKPHASIEEQVLKRRALALKLRENYWQIDPFVRGRVQIDRAGILLPGGKVNATD